MAVREKAAAQRRPLPVWWIFTAGFVALLMALLAGVVLLRLRSVQQGLPGTDLGKAPAAPFQLTDQDGKQISLEQFRGEPVVLTFLYTSCPDACPLIADKLRQTVDLLGPDAAKVAVLAVTTDPAHDDRAAAVRFTQEHGMTGRWHFLLGSPGELAPIWKAYYIGVTPVEQVTPAAGASAGSVIHSDAIYVIDKAGRERTLFSEDFQPKLLAAELRQLEGSSR